MNFLSPWSLLWLVPIGGTIVALYLLKLRRREQVVSSVMLWQAAAQDTQANAPFQKLRRHLLLLLQLLIALFLAFTLARPFLWASGLGGRTTAIVLDASASMKATDEPGGRFARAVAAAKALVKRKAPGDQALVVVAAEKPAVLAPLTGDTGKLIRALDGAASKGYPTDVAGDLREAITFAAAQVASRAGAQVTVLSDGAFDRLDAVALGGAELRFLPVGRRAENVAITAFDVRDTLAGDTRQVFVTLQNFGRSARTLPLEIHVGSNLVAAQEVTLPPGGSKSESFDHIRAGSGGVVTARLDVTDDLAADNEASVALPPPRALKILLVSEGNLFLERGLNAGRRVQLDRAAPGAFKPGAGHDLTVFDGGAAPKDLPPGRYLFWGGPPSGPQAPAARTGPDAHKPEVLDWSRSHPLMRFVDLANVHLRRAHTVAAAPWATTLAETDAGPLIVAGERGDTRAVYVGFPLVDSDLPLRVAFPIFLTNCVDWLAARPGEAGGVHKAGAVVPLAAPPDAGAITIARPDGRTDTLRPHPEGTRTPPLYDATDAVGVYRATGENFAQTFAVSLLSPAESNIAPVKDPRFRIADAAGGRTADAPRAPVRRELWPWIAAIALGILTIEWLVYHRRWG